MDYFNYKDQQLFAEDVPLAEIAERFGTPCYVYSRATLHRHWHAFNDALGEHPHMICYSVKANSNIALLNLLARESSGFDVVSVGEIERVLVAGGQADKIIFAGIGKQTHEIKRALEIGIHAFNLESKAELHLINEVAGQMKKTAPISFRINPDVDPKTHPYISTGMKDNKFGIANAQAKRLYLEARALANVKIVGIACHIGSQITELNPFLEALDCLLQLKDELASEGIDIEHLDLGGGLGVPYQDETPPHPRDYAAAIKKRLDGCKVTIILEPGRAIMANAGILLTEITYIKTNEHKKFVIVDAAMNDLIRPALYQAWQNIIPVKPRDDETAQVYDVVGPVCETADFLGKDRELSVKIGDLLAIRSAGAYGFCMSSNYNSRPRAAEVLVDGNQAHLIRRRESIKDLYAHEQLLAD